MGTATADPPAGLDADLLKKEADDIAGGDDGLGPVDGVDLDPNSEEATGIPGGRQPGDDGYIDTAAGVPDPGLAAVPDPEPEPIAADAGGGAVEPPTPPASLPDDDPGAEVAQTDQLALVADRPLGIKVGGRKPDSSVLKYKGGKVDLGKGQFDRGDRILTVDIWQITGDNDQDTIDKLSGDVKSTSKAQNATLCGTTRIEEYLAEKLSDDPELLERVCVALDVEVPAPAEA